MAPVSAPPNNAATGKSVAIVTGGNRGLGLAVAKGLLKSQRPRDVIITARDKAAGVFQIKQACEWVA